MWCPKCKNEYIEGVTTCVNCAIPLVEELTDENTAPYADEDPGMPLRACDLTSSSSAVHPYVKKDAAYEDTKSTAFTFLVVGLAGLLAIVLIALDVIHLNMESYMRILMFSVMGLLFVIFLVIGMRYQLLLKSLRQEIQEETVMTDEILKWFLDDYSSSAIDQKLADPSLREEPLYFARYEMIEQLILSKYPSLNPSFADHLSEEVYGLLYGEKV